MSFPDADNQEFSDKTLKGFLLKNVDPNTKNPAVQRLNHYLVNRVDQFWDAVVVPLRSAGTFNGNKINWYFEIYKEGIEARRVRENPFNFLEINPEKIRELVRVYDDMTLTQYIELGTSYLSNTYTLLTSWVRDQMIIQRLELVYASEYPLDWIRRAEEEEHGVMEKKPDVDPKVYDVMNNIGLIMSRRV